MQLEVFFIVFADVTAFLEFLQVVLQRWKLEILTVVVGKNGDGVF